MPARNSRSVSFTDQHEEIIRRLSEQLQIPFAEAIRILIDKGLDMAPDVCLSYLVTRRNELQNELQALETKVQFFEKEAAEHPFSSISQSNTQGNTLKRVTPGVIPANSLKVDLKSGHDEFVHFLSRLGFGDALGRAAERIVGAHLGDHPEWFPEIPAEYQPLFDSNRKEGGHVSPDRAGTIPTG